MEKGCAPQPPGIPGVAFSGSGNRTGAPAHSNSICSYNGLNDMNPDQGPIDSIVQTPYAGSPGEAGHGTCAGGTNPERPRRLRKRGHKAGR